MKKEFIGNFEICDPQYISGWAPPSVDGEARTLEIIIDNDLVFRIKADLFREDLMMASIGNGAHAFLYSTPYKYLDGHEHIVTVRDAETGELLLGSPRILVGKTSINAQIELIGGGITGRCEFIENIAYEGVELILREGPSILAMTKMKSLGPEEMQFNFALPRDAFDGQWHKFEVFTLNSNLFIGSFQGLISFAVLDDESTVKFTKGNTRLRSPLSVYRDESYYQSIKKIDNKIHHINELVEINYCYDFLTNSSNEYLPLNFKSTKKSLVTVVIPVHNQIKFTVRCLCSLRLACNKTPFNIIVVNDGSSDETASVLKGMKGLMVVTNEFPQGFIKSINQGVSLASSEFVVFLNNDTEVTNYWLDELINPFELISNVGITGSKLIYPNGKLQEAGGVIFGDGSPINYGKNCNPFDPKYNYLREVDYVSGASLMIRRADFERAGGLSLDLCPAYYDDVDLAFKIRELGLRVIYTPFSEVIHYEGISNGTDIKTGIKKFQEVNKEKFKSSWRHRFSKNLKERSLVDIAKDRGVEKRALILDYECPRPDISAGGYAILEEIKLLQALGFKCTFLASNLAWLDNYTKELQKNGIEVEYSPFTTSIPQFLQRRGKEFDLIYAYRFHVAEVMLDSARLYAPQAKIVVSVCDLHFLREIREAQYTNSEDRMETALVTRERELSLLRRVDLALTYTEAEAAVVTSHNLNPSAIELCPWVLHPPEYSQKFKNTKDIVFFGSLSHRPNVEAILWIVDNLLAPIKSLLPGVNFLIYGSGQSDEISVIEEDYSNIIYRGYVDNISEVYSSARILIAPMQSGAGMKGKVLNAFAWGVPTIISPIAAEGLSAIDSVHTIVARSKDDWVKEIVELYSNEKKWNMISQNSYEFAKSIYSFEKGLKKMSYLMNKLDLY